MPPVSRLLAALLSASALMHAEPLTLTVDTKDPGKEISPDLIGIFFEDISWSADGGLYAELIQNRSFEYSTVSNRTWNNLTCWELVQRGGGKGSMSLDIARPLHPNNPHYVVLETGEPGEGVGLLNAGFDGMPVKAGEPVEFSCFTRQLYTNSRWGGHKHGPLALNVRLEAKDGSLLAETTFSIESRTWTKLNARLVPTASANDARLVVLSKSKGGLAFDEISLFPAKTFHDRPNGLRADLAQVIADLKPRFVRFPGGCLVHGNGVPNIYHWKNTIGPVEQRRQQPNIWGYHQSMGLGYFEYFQFCEDIGAKPLPVVAAGVSCQNSAYCGGEGQEGIPLEQMPAYIQDVLDLIEWANGPADSTWGSKRTAAGHPAPFGLKYLGIGNEDRITPDFEVRYKMLLEAVRAKHPEITLIGTVGPFPDGEDYDAGWKIADELRIPMVDEHYYKSPDWFWDSLQRYDTYDRSRSQVYVGEYAAHDDRRRNTLRSAIAEAAYLTSLERNGDIVRLASYAPLLARRGRTNWSPDLIYFTGTDVYPSINYTVQKLFSHHAGDRYLQHSVSGAQPPARFSTSTVRDTATGDLIVKLVNGTAESLPLDLKLLGTSASAPVKRIVLTGSDRMATNEDGKPPVAQEVEDAPSLAEAANAPLPAHSLTVLRIGSR